MYVACSTLSFARLSFDETLRAIYDQHFQKVDLAIHAHGPHLTPAQVASDVNKLVQKLKASNLSYAAIYLGNYDRVSDESLVHFRAICRLARLMAIPVLTISPDAGKSEIAEEAARLSPYEKCASAEGIQLSLETNGQGISISHDKMIDLCDLVPSLGLTVDPSYYVANLNAWEETIPYANHVRLRDTGKLTEEFQIRVGQGEIDFGRIVSVLERFQYDRALTIDIRDVPDSPFPIDAEVRKLKYVLESLV